MEKTNEIKEAIQAATIVLEKLQEAHKHLKKAKNYGWLDVFRLDIFDIPKRLYMRQAEKCINELKTYIMHFDEELKDVDKIGWYIDVFFKGHLSKMMGLKNSYSKMYEDEMAKYKVDKPEYENDDEALFDAVFNKGGGSS